MHLNYKYLICFLIILSIEIFIAIYVHDNIVRPLVGDILVIILMYCFFKIFINKNTLFLPLYLFIFSVSVEIMQYINIVEILNLQNNSIMSILIGSTFDIMDIICYLFSTLILVLWEFKFELK